MASIFSHAVVGVALAPIVLPGRIPARVRALGALAGMIPDADVVGLRLGIAYRDLLGHRGLTHSLAFAAALAALLLPLAGAAASRGRLWTYLALTTASHGVLDALTNGGVGVAFFAPFFSEWGRRGIRQRTPLDLASGWSRRDAGHGQGSKGLGSRTP